MAIASIEAGQKGDVIRAKLNQLIARANAFRDVTEFGAVMNGSTDGTEALQAAIDDLPESGGAVFIPNGTLRITDTITIEKPNVRIISTGPRHPYPGGQIIDPGEQVEGPGMIFSDHAGPAFLFGSSDYIDGFRFEDITLVSVLDHYDGSVAFQFDIDSENFRRDFIFRNATISTFGTAFLLDKAHEGTELAMGVLRVHQCNIAANGFIARTTNGAIWNGFYFTQNEAGNNGYAEGLGGIVVNALSVDISDNILEGNRDAIRIAGSYRGLVIKGNYFETNPGVAPIHLNDCTEFDIGPNYYGPGNETKVVLDYCGNGRCLDGYTGTVYKTPFPTGAKVNARGIMVPSSGVVHLFHVDAPVFGPNHAVTTSTTLTPDTSITLNGSTGTYGKTNTIASGAGLCTQSATIGASSGQFLVCQFIFRVNHDPVDDPYLIVDLNGNDSAGSYQTPLSLQSILHFRTGEWAHVTAIVRANTTVTSVTVNFYPYGINPANAGTISYCITPLQVAVVDDINLARPGYKL